MEEELQPPEEQNTPLEQFETGPPLSLEERMEAQRAELEELIREKGQFREMLQRCQADFMNYKRRTDEEREELYKYSNSRLILKLLPVLDDFHLALEHTAEAEAEASWLEGIMLIHRKLTSMLESEQVARIDAEGREFDPLEHEAMAYQDSNKHQDGHILSVAREGYKLHGRVIRPALVILARSAGTEREEDRPSLGEETENA